MSPGRIVAAIITGLTWMATSAQAANTRNILVTGYWPPTNEMLRSFSTSPIQNPDGWIGEDWEGRGYDVHAFFPECDPVPNPGRCSGDLEVDYQDTSPDWWRIVGEIRPVAIVTFSRGFPGDLWEVELNQFNRASWVNDYEAPRQPTPAPPDDGVPAETLRPSTLPVDAIVNAVTASGLPLTAFVDDTGDGGAFLSEFVAYHGVWYQSLHASECDPTRCVMAGHVHVGIDVGVDTAREAVFVTLRTVMGAVDAVLAEPLTCAEDECAVEAACADFDHDMDGIRNGDDCSPLDAGSFATPGAVDRLTVGRPLAVEANEALLTWTDLADVAGPDVAYDVVSGLLTELRADGGFTRAACLERGVAGRPLVDARAAGGGLYYLVRGRNACGSGTHGPGGRSALDATSPCD